MGDQAWNQQSRIDTVIREIHQALVEAATRGELEERVCEVIADSGPYRFAWIGEHDTTSGEVVPRAAAGVDPSYLEDISIPVGDDSQPQGPTAAALRDESVQVMQHIREDPAYEPWREQALERGFESSAAVPIATGGTLYGVLNVYSSRPGAFDDTEQELLGELGETFATAIDGIQARRELQSQKDRYETLTERISDAYYAVNSDWQITYWNDRMAERTDTPAKRVEGDVLWDAFPELLGTDIESQYRTAMEHQEPLSGEHYLEDPYDYWVEIDVYPDEDGLSIFSREITDRKERERELARAQRRLEAIVHNTSEAIYLKHRDGEYRFVNDVGAEVFGMSPDEVVGHTDHDLFDPDSADDIRADDRQVMETGEAATWERVRFVDGEEHVFIDNKFPYRNESGDVIGLMGVSRDITERKQRERELEETTTKLDAIIRAAPDPIVMLDEDLEVVLWNPGAERVFGWSEEEIIGERAPFVPKEKEGEFRELVENLDEGLQNRFVDTFRRAKDGERIDVGLSSAKVEAGDTFSGYLGIFKDIRQRKRYGRQIEELHDATRALIDVDDKQEAAEIIVDAADDLLGFPFPSIWYRSHDGSSLELVADTQAHEELLRDAGVSAPAISREDRLWEIFRAGEPVVRDPIPPEDLSTDIPLTSAIFVPLGEHGLLSYATRGDVEFDDETITLATLLGQNATVALDSIERKSELKEQRDNLELLDQMVRHDIRNDLQTVSGYASHLRDNPEDAQRAAHLDEIFSSANTAVELTRSAGELAEVMLQSRDTRKPISLERTLESQVEKVRATNERASVTIDGQIPDVEVLADEMLSSLFRNLLKNAIQHNEKAVPEVHVSVTRDEKRVRVQVADNGPGVPDDRKEAIFGKGEMGLESGGTGIGLYLVQTLVEKYGGSVRVEDNDPEGSIFTVELPVAG